MSAEMPEADGQHLAATRGSQLPRIIALIGALLLIVSLFLPLATAVGDDREALEEYPDTVLDKDLDITAGEMEDLTIVEFGSVYHTLAISGYSVDESTVRVVIIIVFAACGVLTALFSALRKPVPTIVFAVLAMAALALLRWDLGDTGVVDGGRYTWGVGLYLSFVGTAVAVAGAIMMIAQKTRLKAAA